MSKSWRQDRVTICLKKRDAPIALLLLAAPGDRFSTRLAQLRIRGVKRSYGPLIFIVLTLVVLLIAFLRALKTT